MTTASSNRPVAEQVDLFIAARKHLLGAPVWNPGNRLDYEWRMKWLLMVEEVEPDSTVWFTAYPNDPELRFTITLNIFDRNVWRIDYVPDNHIAVNPFRPGHPLSGKTVSGPHYHSWSDNRYAATTTALPEKLPMRQRLPGGILASGRHWENACRWFFDEVNIAHPAIPDLPPRTRLL